jgi:hypothetical protein
MVFQQRPGGFVRQNDRAILACAHPKKCRRQVARLSGGSRPEESDGAGPKPGGGIAPRLGDMLAFCNGPRRRQLSNVAVHGMPLSQRPKIHRSLRATHIARRRKLSRQRV